VNRQAEQDETDLVLLLRKGDPEAFRELVRRHHASMLRVAATFVPTASDAEDVVQDTWIAVIRGLDGFQGRASLRSWIFTILVNRARTHGAREARRAATPSAAPEPAGGDAYAVPEDQFTGRRGRGSWRQPVPPWQDDPQLRVDSEAGVAVIMAAIAELPPARRQVVVLRDVEGWTAAQVSELLGLSAANQRVLLHRARASLRLALAAYAEPDPGTGEAQTPGDGPADDQPTEVR